MRDNLSADKIKQFAKEIKEEMGTNTSGVNVQANNITQLCDMLIEAAEALEYYDNHESVIKEAYHSNAAKQITVVHTFINHKATETLSKLAGRLG